MSPRFSSVLLLLFFSLALESEAAITNEADPKLFYFPLPRGSQVHMIFFKKYLT